MKVLEYPPILISLNEEIFFSSIVEWISFSNVICELKWDMRSCVPSELHSLGATLK